MLRKIQAEDTRRLRLLRPQLKTSQRLMWNPQKLPSSRMFVVVALTLTSCHVPTSLGQEAPTYAERLDELSHVLSHAQSGKTYRLGDLLEAVHAKHLLEMTPVAVQQAVMEAAGTLSRNGEDFSAAVSGTDVGEVSQPANVSALCLNHTIATMFGLLLRKEWALQMLDATGKPSPGLTDGNFNWPGSYDYCRRVRSNNTRPIFSGQYCTAQLIVNPQGLFWPDFPVAISLGICVPDTCSDQDITFILNAVQSYLNVTMPVFATCPRPKTELDGKAAAAIVILSIMLTLMVVGTVLDILFVQRPLWHVEEVPQLLTNEAADDEERRPLVQHEMTREVKLPENGLIVRLLISFSVYTNASKLLSTKQAPGSLTCMHGIRFLSMTWVILGHSFLFPLFTATNAVPYYGDLIKRWTFQGVANAVLSVDTFFAISGLLVTYLSLKQMRKREGKMNWLLFFFHRIWRLTPAYMLILMVYVCLTPYWGEGPLWPQTIPDRDNCLTSWWANFLYINNLVKSTTSDICMVQTWYLANDMQFHILSPLIFVPLYFNKFAGLAVSGVFILITAIVPGVLTTTHHYPPSILPDTLDSNDTNLADALNNFYSKPYNRMGPYVIGMLAGYFLYHTDCRLKINKIVNLSIWAVATGSAMGVVYGLYDAYNGHPITLSVAAFYNAVNRQVWALCVSWVVVACVTGNGGFVNTILSWRALIPLSRLTYCVYLMHIMMMELYLYNSAIPFYMSDLTVVSFFLTMLVLTYMGAMVASLAFEAPMMALEKVIFARKKREDERAPTENRNPQGNI